MKLKNKCAKDSSDAIENFFRNTDSNDSGEPLNSYCKADDNTVSDLMGESVKVRFLDFAHWEQIKSSKNMKGKKL
eukprot:6092697-Ditylum_brightwellii.AAC.1